MNNIFERYRGIVSLRITSLPVSVKAPAKTRFSQTHLRHISFVVEWPTNPLFPDRSLSLQDSKVDFGRRLQLVDQRRSFSSQSNSIDIQNDEVSPLPSLPISSQVTSSTLSNRFTSLDMVRLQRPSERFVSNRSDQEWEQLHQKIMSSSAKDKVLKKMDVIDAEQCMRWRIAQCRSHLQKNKLDLKRNNRYKSMIRTNSQSAKRLSEQHSKLAAQAIVSALDLFGRIAFEIEAQPELLHIDPSINTTMIDEQLRYWYDGRVPKATHLLNAILDAWRICWTNINPNNNKYLPTPQSIFTLLKDKWSNLVPMNERTYSIVMDAPVSAMKQLGNTQPKYEVPLFCEKVIEFMLERKIPKEVPGHSRQFGSEMSTLPDNVAYATALNAWARSGHPDAASRAENLFNQFSTLCSNGTLGTMPNSFCYNTVLVAMTTPSNSYLKYRPLLLKRSVNPDETFDQSMVDNILNRQQAMLRAEDVLRTMQLCPYPNVMADTMSFRTMIFSWAEYSLDLRYIDRKKSLDAMNQAKGLLFEMSKLHVDSSSDAIEVDFNFFGKLISTLVLNQPRDIDDHTKDDLRLAEEIYHYMLTLYRTTRDERFTPDPSLMHAMILLYAKDGRPLEADAVLRRLEDEARLRNQVSLLPRMSYYYDTLVSFVNVAEGEIKSGKHQHAGTFANKAESIILRMIDIAVATDDIKAVPDRTTIQSMFELWISCRMPQRAENYFRTIEKLHETTKCRELRWSPYYFRKLLNAWATECNDSTIYAAEAAEAILNEQQRRYEKTHDVGYKLSAVSISLVISAWLRTDYDQLVDKCKSLFDEATLAYESGNTDARPDVTLYGTVFKSFSRVGDGKGAIHFLETMITDYCDNGNFNAKPNIGIFNMVLLSWLRSKDYKAPARALEVLEMMDSFDKKNKAGLKPDVRTYSILSEIFEHCKIEGPMYDGKYEYFVEQRQLLENKERSS